MDITSIEFWKVVGAAVLCGAIVGLERQIRGKVAGIRTSIMVCLGTSLFIMLGLDCAGPGVDSTRVLGQVVTGIGFLGAGVILARGGQVLGVTSAAVIWVLAALGAMVGFQKHAEAVVVALLSVALLTTVGFLERKTPSLRRGVHAANDEVRREH